MNILLIGNNYTTKVLAQKLGENTKNTIFSTINANGCNLVNINFMDFEKLIEFSKNNNIDLIIPSDFRILESDFDSLALQNNLNVFAPIEDAIGITASKSFAKKFFYKNKINTPKFIVLEKQQIAYDYIKKANYPIVIKSDKHSDNISTEFAETYTRAKIIIDKFFNQNVESVIIEDFVEGKEFSAYILTDGFNIRLLDIVQTKLNRFASLGANFLDKKQREKIIKEFFEPIILNLAKYDMEYVGILGIDFVIDRNNNIFALECNPFFENIDIELFTKSIKDDLADIFENILLGTFTEKYKKIKTDNRNYLSLINNDGEIEIYEGRTLSEAIENIGNEDLVKEIKWKY